MNPTRPAQRDLISRSMSAQIPLRRDHPLVQAADSLDWGGDPASCTRDSTAAGRHPHLRALLGAVLFMGLRKRPYRETEDVLRYYVE